MRSSEKGFSLVELLVVIAILSIISALVLVAVDPATKLKEARDAQRKQDINQIANALVTFHTLHGRYPNEILPEPACDSSKGSITGGNCTSVFPFLGSDWSSTSGIYVDLIGQQFLKLLPKDPINKFSNGLSLMYSYEPRNSSESPCTTTRVTCAYWIGALLEKPKGPTLPIFRCSDIDVLAAGTGCKEVSNWNL